MRITGDVTQYLTIKGNDVKLGSVSWRTEDDIKKLVESTPDCLGGESGEFIESDGYKCLSFSN